MTSNRRYYAVAQKLVILPPEVLHRVLDDLPLIKILEVISVHDVPYVDSCMLSHIHYKEIFPTPQSLSTLKQYFILYVELCQLREKRNTQITILTRDAARLVKQNSNSPGLSNRLLAVVKAEIISLLKTYEPHIQILAKFSPQPITGQMIDSSDPDTLRYFFTNVDAAEKSLNQTKSSQLQRIAQLYAEYPGTLRQRLDASQESRRHSDRHRIDSFQLLAKRILKPQIVGATVLAKNIFAANRLPVIPYDRHLKTFLKLIEKFPLDHDNSILPAASGRQRRVKAHSWPPETAVDIKKVIDGLAYVYPKTLGQRKNSTPILRTKYTRYSDREFSTSVGGKQPCFLDGFADDAYGSLGNDISPLEEKEFEWLEAFLRSCRYMGGMDGIEWTAGVTVKQFRSIHTGDDHT